MVSSWWGGLHSYEVLLVFYQIYSRQKWYCRTQNAIYNKVFDFFYDWKHYFDIFFIHIIHSIFRCRHILFSVIPWVQLFTMVSSWWGRLHSYEVSQVSDIQLKKIILVLLQYWFLWTPIFFLKNLILRIKIFFIYIIHFYNFRCMYIHWSPSSPGSKFSPWFHRGGGDYTLMRYYWYSIRYTVGKNDIVAPKMLYTTRFLIFFMTENIILTYFLFILYIQFLGAGIYCSPSSPGFNFSPWFHRGGVDFTLMRCHRYQIFSWRK